MKLHTNNFKTQIALAGRELDDKLTYLINDKVVVLNSEDLNTINPVYEGNILKSVMKELDIDCNVDIPKDTVINYKLGVKVNGSYEYLDYGNYIVYSSNKSEDTNSYNIVAYDKMLYSMKSYEKFVEMYPITINNYIDKLCQKIGLVFKNKNDDYANKNKIISNELYIGEDSSDMGYTYRDVLDELAQVTASTICINEKTDELEIRYVGQNKNFNELASNERIIKIENAIEDNLEELKAYGKSEQEKSNPSPNYPSEIESIPFIKNLFNKDNVTNGYRLGGAGLPYVDSLYSCGEFIEVKPNKQYILQKVKQSSSSAYCLYDNTHNFIERVFTNDYDIVEIETTNTTNYIRITDLTENLDSIQLEEGSVAHLYVPYGNYLRVDNKGKNLIKPKFDTQTINGVTVSYDKDTQIFTLNGTGTQDNTVYIFTGPIVINGTYTLSVHYVSGSVENAKSSTRIQLFNNSNWNGIVTPTLSENDVYTTATFGDDLNLNSNSIRVDKDVIFNNYKIQIMLEKSPIATEYRPYEEYKSFIDLQGNELCSVGDIKDELLVKYNKVSIIKRIGSHVFNGTEYVSRMTINDSSKWRFIISVTNCASVPSNEIKPILCNITVQNSRDEMYKGIEGIGYGNEPNFVQFYLDETSNMTVSEFKNYLKQKYDDDTPVIVYYILAEPEIIDLENIEPIKLDNGTNYVTLNEETSTFTKYTVNYDTIDEEYLKDVNVNFGDKYGPINSVVLSRSASADNIFLRDEKSILQNGLCEIKIEDNQIMNWDNRNEFLSEILGKLNRLEFYTNDFSSTGICYYDLCDRYNVQIGKNLYSCVMFNDETNRNDGLEEIIFTELPNENKTDYSKADKNDRRINQTTLIVNKQNQTITSVIKKVDNNEEKLVEFKATLDGISQTVSDTKEYVEKNVELLRLDLDTNVIIIPTDTSNKPIDTKNYDISYIIYYKGSKINIQPSTMNINTGISVNVTNSYIRFSVNKDNIISNLDNKYTFTVSYTDNDNKSYTLSKTVMISLAVQGEDGKESVVTSDTAPTDTTILWMDTINNQLKRYNGQSWEVVNDFSDDVDSINSTITNLTNSTQNQYNELNSQLTQLRTETETQWTQTNNSFDFRFNTLQNTVNTKTGELESKVLEQSKYIRFENGNLIIGVEGNEYKLVETNTGIEIQRNGTPIAYFVENRLYVDEKGQIQLGKFAFTPRSNGSLDFGKVSD